MDTRIVELLKGDRRTIAKLISEMENSPKEQVAAIIRQIFSYTGKGYIIGITGLPGCGKSTLVEKLALEYRSKGKRVAIIAVDPSSQNSGGAFMGNRVRMREASNEREIYIRSMASRGSLGGISQATSAAVKILDAVGMDYIIIETVGAGQVQTDIARAAYTVVVMVQPETGDAIQAAKAGLMEIGDIFVIDKSDLRGASKTANDLEEFLNMGHIDAWKPRVIRTIATKGTGITELIQAIDEHKKFLISSKQMYVKQKDMLRNEVIGIIEDTLRKRFFSSLKESEIESTLNAVVSRKLNPYDAAEEIMQGKPCT